MPLVGSMAQSQSASYYASIFDKRYPGKGLGNAYLAYASQHGNYSPYKAAQGFLLILSTQGLAAALQQGIGATGQATAVAADTSANTLADVAHGFNLGNILLRVGETILGIVLIGVGVAKITGASNLISKAVKAKI